MHLNKNYLLYVAVIIGIVVAYQFVGEVAIGGLLALFLGSKKGNQKRIDDVEQERDEHEELLEQSLNSAAIHHEKAQKLADEITQPKEPVKPGRRRVHLSTRK